ncbi:hypothetical protein CR513_01744, partial [Mucuna pruriens]
MIEHKLRKETKMTKNQFGFMLGRFITKVIYLLRRLIDMYQSKERDLHILRFCSNRSIVEAFENENCLCELYIRHSKMKYAHCNFSKKKEEYDLEKNGRFTL